MTALICNRCLNIPYIQFLPGLKIKFSCCKSMLITHFDLDERINFFYSLKCQRSSCLKKEAFINYTYGELICDKCLKNKKKKYLKKILKMTIYVSLVNNIIKNIDIIIKLLVYYFAKIVLIQMILQI